MDTTLANRQKSKGKCGRGTSAWNAVHSGVSQCSVMGRLLLLIYINDLEDGFADATTIFRRVQTRQVSRITGSLK